MTTTAFAPPPLAQTPRRVSVSTWALHSLLGTVGPGRPGSPDDFLMPSRETSDLALLEVPAALAARGIHTMELCHFHLPSRRDDFLAELRQRLSDSGVELWSLLIDDGDITHPENGDRDRLWTEGWIETAGILGARCVRVVAGKQPPTPENFQHSREQLTRLVIHAFLHGVHVMTENWFALLDTPETVHALLEDLNGAVGLTLDFGNWDRHDDKYADLRAIAGRASGCHAKCAFQNGLPDSDDFRRCLNIARSSGFSGPYTLVHGEPGSVWESIQTQSDIVKDYL